MFRARLAAYAPRVCAARRGRAQVGAAPSLRRALRFTYTCPCPHAERRERDAATEIVYGHVYDPDMSGTHPDIWLCAPREERVS